jgi:hypothetical protein
MWELIRAAHLVAFVGGLIAWHLRRPDRRVSTWRSSSTPAIVWFGVTLAH